MGTLHVKYFLFFFFRIMPGCRKPAKRSKNNWNETNIESALNMCRKGKSICASMKAYGMSEATLQNRFKLQEEGETLVASGRKIAIGEQKEKQLADCIKTTYNVGFSPLLLEIKEIVREYVESKKLRTPFKNNRPGRKWVKRSMKHNNEFKESQHDIFSTEIRYFKFIYSFLGFMIPWRKLCQKNNFFPCKYGI